MKKEFPKVHFYDHDLSDMYDFTFNRLREAWKKGTGENGLQGRYLSLPASDRINQVEACAATFFLVYSNRAFPAHALLDNFYAKQEADGAIRGEYSEKSGKPVSHKANPEGVLPPLFAWAEHNIYHKIGLKKRVKDVMPVLSRHFAWLEKSFKRDNGLYAVPLEATGMTNAPRREAFYPVDFNTQVALNALYLSALADILNDKETAYQYKKAYFGLKTRINSQMWNEKERMYYDLDRKGSQVKVKTIASFWPLLAEIPNEAKSEALIQHLSDPHTFGLDHPFPTLAASEKDFDPRGGGYHGSVFPHLTYMVIKGLEKYGKFELARESAVKHLYCDAGAPAHREGLHRHPVGSLFPDPGRSGGLERASGFPALHVPALRGAVHHRPDDRERHRHVHQPAAQDRGLDHPQPGDHGHRGPGPEAQRDHHPEQQERPGLGDPPGVREAVLPDHQHPERQEEDPAHPFGQVLDPHRQDLAATNSALRAAVTAG